jgi:uncharacterized membrane protein YhhN
MPINRTSVAALTLSTILAIAYGAYSSSLYEGAPPFIVGTVFKASSIVILGAIAIWTAGASPAGADIGRLERAPPGAQAGRRLALPPSNKLLAAGLLFGATGDALLAWSPDTFLYGALAFLIGHLFYITLFLRAGIGIAAALKQPPRLIAAVALIIAAFAMTSLLVPRDNPMFAPLAVYTGVLTLMAICSFTLPWERRLVMIGAVLFFISDGFVAWNMFHHDPDPTLAYWRSFAGWMIYWAGQGAICMGALGLHKKPPPLEGRGLGAG